MNLFFTIALPIAAGTALGWQLRRIREAQEKRREIQEMIRSAERAEALKDSQGDLRADWRELMLECGREGSEKSSTRLQIQPDAEGKISPEEGAALFQRLSAMRNVGMTDYEAEVSRCLFPLNIVQAEDAMTSMPLVPPVRIPKGLED